ncbi:MAG: hypothetical protein EOM21_02050 [Gammaproteobacteria bacterium]|nr:hypothetical protein [Gammaproteobacteria bacterium]
MSPKGCFSGQPRAVKTPAVGSCLQTSFGIALERTAPGAMAQRPELEARMGESETDPAPDLSEEERQRLLDPYRRVLDTDSHSLE